MKALNLFIALLLTSGCFTSLHAQKSDAKKKDQMVLSEKQKIKKTDFDSIWKFTDFTPKGKYYVDFDYNSFLEMPKKVKYWGAMEPLINYMMSNTRQAITICAVYAINPAIDSPVKKKQLKEQSDKNAREALLSFEEYIKENQISTKSVFQVAEIDYRYWMGDDFYTLPAPKEEVMYLGLLVSLGTKKNTFFPVANTEHKAFKNIKFFPNNSDLIDSYKSVIKEIADYLATNDRLEVSLIGYSDNSGTETYNINISSKRAEVIKNELIKLNVPPYKIEVIGMGSSNPIGDNNTHEGKVANNRVEIKIR